MKLTRLRPLTAALVLSVSSFTATATPISLDQLNGALSTIEAQMEAIFAATNITDIVFMPVIQITDPADYLNIDTAAKQNDVLFNNTLGQTVPPPIVTAYVVDTISYCNGVNESIIGCATFPPLATMYLEGSYLLGSLADELFAHELGHNFNLSHTVNYEFLMGGSLGDGNSMLNAAQIATINASSLIQNGAVTIKTVLLAAYMLPEASTSALVLIGLIGMLFARRRRLKD